MTGDSRRAKVFLVAAVAWSVGLFAFSRVPLVEQGVVVPLTALQQQAAEYYTGPPAAPMAVTLECSGMDVLALCLAAILACPVAWRARLAGIAGGVVFVLALNIVRIASLGLAAGSPALFESLHLQVWPAILLVATAGYVLAWMRLALAAPGDHGKGDGTLPALARRFAPRAVALLFLFALGGPWIARSESLLAAGAWVAGLAGLLLASAGIGAAAAGNVLTTSRGAFIVTPECLATAFIPLYVAGVLTARRGWRWRAAALAAGPPLFAALAVVRLLLLALPPAVAASPLFLVHGFHQLVLGVLAVSLLAAWREPTGARAARRAGVALAAAAGLAFVAGGALTAAVLAVARAVAALASHTLTDLTNPGDAQGALLLLPAYQACLLVALGIAASAGWRRLLPALGVLLASQVVFLVILAEIADHAGLVAHALLLRGWSVAAPVALALVMIRSGPPAARTLPLRPADDVH